MNILDFENNNSLESKDSAHGPIINQGTYNGKMVIKIKPDFYTVDELKQILELAIGKNNRYEYCKSVNYDIYQEKLYPVINKM